MALCRVFGITSTILYYYGRAVFCTLLQFLGTIDIMQDVGSTARKDSPESMVFVFVVVVSVVIACSCAFASSSSTSSPLSLELLLGCRSRNRSIFRKVFLHLLVFFGKS